MRVLAHHVQERELAAPELLADELQHEAAGEAAALPERIGADAAHLPQGARLHALARHRDEPSAVEHAPVVAELDGPRPERSRLRRRDQREHPGHVRGSEARGVERIVALGRAALPHHLVRRGVLVDPPAAGAGAAPSADVDLLAHLAEGRERVEVGPVRIREADDRRKAARIALRGRGSFRETRLGPGERVPDDVGQQVERHRRIRPAARGRSGSAARASRPAAVASSCARRARRRWPRSLAAKRRCRDRS